MEKNVPLLKLIHDPWSIKTMLSSRFTSVPLHPRAPARDSESSLLQGSTEAEGGVEKKRRGRGWREGYSFLSAFSARARVGMRVVVVSSLAAVGRCWCSRDCGNLRSSTENRIDGCLKSPQERKGGGAEEYIRLFPFGWRRGDAAPPPRFLLRWLLSPTDFSNSSSLPPEF